jgi:alkylated DNA repair dioxygenase AlkB
VTTSIEQHELRPGIFLLRTRLPDDLRLDSATFEALWHMHPPEQPEVTLEGTSRLAPRWHQSYGQDYEFAGAVSRAEPVPPILAPILSWSREAIDARLNGILVNWYEADGEHRIARHKDSPIRRIPGCPIVTASLGASRTFRMHVGKKVLPFRVGDGDVIVIPDETNRRFAHSVPHLPEDQGRRISVTLRGFTEET